MILPHGGQLINQELSQPEKQKILNKADQFKGLNLDKEQIKDVLNIARGVYSPLKGFLKKQELQSVVENMRLQNGTVWPIPIVLDINTSQAQGFFQEKSILLKDQENTPVALLENIEIYQYDKDLFAKNVFGTLDRNHPGAEEVYKMNQYLIGGEIKLLNDPLYLFPEHNFTPQETRAEFQKRGWKSIVAFQTRNVPHSGHEYLQKAALQEVDGLFIQPVIGEKKLEDFKDEYIVASYEILIDKHFPKNKVFLGILPLRMRYAGPKEAVFHAIIRKNFGCSHFIVGRDHAGVGNYYGAFEAQEIFDKFKEEEIKVKIMKFQEVLYCPACKKHVFLDECTHRNRISFSGTQMRQGLTKKEPPPFYIMRPEVYNLIINSYNSLVDYMYKNNNNKKQGLVLWFTGLSQSGKTTNADAVYEALKQRGITAERLDGDIMRQHLARDLGFSKEDRNENIRRAGFVAKLLARNKVAVIASFITPYKAERDRLRQEIDNFIEVFCNCPLEACEARDNNGLYQKARNGDIENFTGISDPYETPESPDIILDTANDTPEQNKQKIISFLEEKELI
jgi:sulfate adenylyltransferase